MNAWFWKATHQEEVVWFRWKSTVLEESKEVVVLAMNVALKTEPKLSKMINVHFPLFIVVVYNDNLGAVYHKFLSKLNKYSCLTV